MAHLTTAVFLVLLLCSASLGCSTATEYNVMTISTESGDYKQDDVHMIKEPQKKMTKYHRARKMGGFEMKKKMDATETGANPSIGKSVNGVMRDLSKFKGGSAKASVVGFLPTDYHQPRSHRPVHN